MSWTKTLGALAIVLAVGVAAGWTLQRLAPALDAGPKDGEEEREVKYWVAPMDPSYRRDEPGKSPMGMDLVPVYEGEEPDEPGTVTIEPAVVNNLGVRTATVERTTLSRRIETVGYVDYNEDLMSHVHLRTEAWIERMAVKSEGERVEKGQLLFEVYSPTLVNAQEEYLQALASGDRGLIDASERRLDALGVSGDQIARLRETRRVEQLVAIRARQDGIIANLNVRQGMYVKPENEVMALADLSSVWLLAEVFERQAEWVDVGQPAEVHLPFLPGREWSGEVDYIYPTLDSETHTVKARLRFDNPDEELKPEMYAAVTIAGGPKRDVLAVPREAVIRTGSMERVVLAQGEGRYRPIRVVTGMQSGDRVEIRRGLSEGDRVVTSAQFLIDSESNVDAEFKRMRGRDGEQEQAPADAGPVTATGTVKARGEKALTIAHDPVPELDWPSMTMDFALGEGVSADGIEPGEAVRFTLERQEGDGYAITAIEPRRAHEGHGGEP